MSKSIKAVLLSALVFPGLGHFFLKKYIAAVVLAGTAFISIYWLVAATVEQALKISEKIQSGEVQLDAASITAMVSEQSTGTEAQLINIATVVLVIVWLIAIVDAYRLARLQDKADAASA